MDIALDSLIKRFGLNAIEFSEVAVEQYLFVSYYMYKRFNIQRCRHSVCVRLLRNGIH